LERTLFGVSGIAGALAVALGAFGAHGLRAFLAALEDGAQRRAWWDTAAHYHLAHALAIAVAAYLCGRSGGSGPAVTAGFCFAGGIVLFSGSLYAMTLTGVRALGAVTPLGGLLFIAGWLAIAVAAFRLP
jgi:uncharacterized membrane protein YgdD (TMEM256/DUF423 family)